MANVTEIQQRLVALGFSVGPDGIDGRFGQNTLDAYNRFRASNGRGPVSNVTMAELSAALFPSPTVISPKGTIMGNVLSGILGNLFKWEMLQSYLRNALLAVSGGFVTNGIITSDQQATIVGAVLIVLGVLWSMISNNTKIKAVQVVKAVEANPDVNLVPADASLSGKPAVVVNK